MNLFATILTALVSAGLGAVGAYVALRKEGRETRQEKTDASDRTIELLEKQNSILERQVAESNAREERREREFAEERAEWRRRVERLEQWRDREIESRKQLGMCAKANQGCKDYDPGDISPECTD